MGLLSGLKVMWLGRKAIVPTAKAISDIKEAAMKSGWKTTEFWMTIVTNIITVVGALEGYIDPKTAGIVLAAANGIYGVLRSLVKSNTPAK